jgi:hypothetical protein
VLEEHLDLVADLEVLGALSVMRSTFDLTISPSAIWDMVPSYNSSIASYSSFE